MNQNSKPVLFLIPFAGGSAYNLQGLASLIKNADTIILECPGRGSRFPEPLLDDIDAIVNDLLAPVLAVVRQGRQFAIYGHSMGTLIGYLLSRKIYAYEQVYPTHLFVSGSGAPGLAGKRNWHLLPEDEFWKVLSELGGCQQEILENAELKTLFGPIVRADLAAIDSYTYVNEPEMDVEITVLKGVDDEAELVKFQYWQRVTNYPVDLREFEGDHFFIYRHLDAIAEIIDNKLQTVDYVRNTKSFLF
jgi:surfactin synthase thioesterase subunit